MEDFVPYEIAKKLKEKGFNEPCFGYYHLDNGDDSFEVCGNGDYDFLNSKNTYRIGAPRISQVLKWLRKEKKLHVVCPFYKDKGYYYYVQNVGNAARIVSSFDDSDECFESSEQAALAGIEHILDNLILEEDYG